MSRFATTKEDAEKIAAELNNQPTEDGKRRNPFKVYEIKATQVKSGFAVGQSPTAALGAAADCVGVVCELVQPPELPKLNKFLSNLTPEEIEKAKAFLASK